MRVPADYRCTADATGATRCDGPLWSVVWNVDEDTTTDVEAARRALVARGDKEGGGGDYFVADATIVGVPGWISVRPFARRPGVAWSFQGWAPDATRGRVVVRITASAFATETHDQPGLDALAVLASTSAASNARAAAWPSARERSTVARALAAHATLVDDARNTEWAGAARNLTDGAPMLGTAIRGYASPDVSTLLATRAFDLAEGDEARVASVSAVAQALTVWDPTAADAELEWLQRRVLARAKAAPDRRARGRLLAVVARLSRLRYEQHDEGALVDLAEALATEDASLVLADVAPHIHHRAWNNPRLGAALATWLDASRPFHPDADHVGISQWLGSMLQIEPLRRAFLERLARDGAGGEIEIVSTGAVLHTPSGDRSCGVPANLPEEGRRIRVTLGDVYACGVARGAREAGFYGWSSRDDRDRARRRLIEIVTQTHRLP